VINPTDEFFFFKISFDENKVSIFDIIIFFEEALDDFSQKKFSSVIIAFIIKNRKN